MAKFKGKKRKVKKTKEIKKDVGPKTRKDIRKEKRMLKKVHKREYFSKSSDSKEAGKFVKAPKETDEDTPLHVTLEKIKNKNNKNPAKSTVIDKSNIILEENKGAKKKEEKLKTQMKQQRNSQLLKANKEEDKIIKKLEKQLKLKKRKSGNISKSFAADGLGYLLEVCDERTMQAAIAAEKHLAETGSGSDFEEDIAIATGKSTATYPKKSPNKSQDSDASSNSDLSDNEDLSDDFDDLGTESEDEVIETKFNKENKLKSSKLKDNSTNKKTKKVSPKVIKKNNNSKKDTVPSDSEDSFSDPDSDMNLGDETEDEESDEREDDMDDEMRGMICSGMSSFPDESFQPGNLTPVKEETEQDLDLYQKNIEVPIQTSRAFNNTSVNDSIDSDIESDLEEEEMEIDNDSEEIMPSSDDSECSNSDCCNDHSEDQANNKKILVNGKVINTYGRDYQREVEPEIVKCPELDKLLENLSSAESECEKSFEKNKGEKNYKENLKRKNNDDSNPKKKKQKPDTDVSPKTKMNPKTIKKVKAKNSVEVPISDNENEDTDDCMESNSFDEVSENEDESSGGEEKGDVWEDIYGRQRDKDGNVITNQVKKYVPPHLRVKKELEDSKEIQQLKRQIKGLLNKVALSNMHWTGGQLEGLYSSNSRNAVNNAFCSLWLDALVQGAITPDRMAAEHTMLVAILHANVGSEVGAHFLQTVVKNFDEMLKVEQNLENKRLDNLILAISHLYSFKIFQAPLLYEILNKLLEKLSEKSVECTLVALRAVGGVLRKEDPLSLKTFIQTTQERASKFNDATTKGSRVKFLLDVLLAIKNNNMNKIPNYDPSYMEELKKSMKVVIRKGNYIVPLNIKLEDLLKADERGKWWVVGSAWEGSSRVEKEESSNTKKPTDKKYIQLMELAAQQRINTDLRKNIFFIIMSAENYMDAFEKLQQLGLKNQQERELINIIIFCCLQEKIYNPFYAVLAQKYCDYDRKFQMSIQYCVWDKLKEIETFPPFQIATLGQFLTYLFIEKGLPISVLKVVQFSDLTKSTLRLMRQILLAILLHKNWQTCLEVFQRVAVSPKLRPFREGLRLFISHFLVKNSDKKSNVLTEEQTELLKERASAVNKTLSSDTKLQF